MKNWKKIKEKFFPLLVPKLNLGTSKVGWGEFGAVAWAVS